MKNWIKNFIFKSKRKEALLDQFIAKLKEEETHEDELILDSIKECAKGLLAGSEGDLVKWIFAYYKRGERFAGKQLTSLAVEMVKLKLL